MDWLEESPESIAVDLDGSSDWNGTASIQIYAFSGQISSFGEYEPFIYGIVWEVTLAGDAASGGGGSLFSIWVPLGRGLTLDAVEEVAEGLAEEILPLPSPITDNSANCFLIYSLRRDTHVNEYLIDIDACGGDAFNGFIAGAGVGAGIGAVLGTVPGAAIGAAIGGTIGTAIGHFGGKSKCIDNVTDDYNKDYRRDWNCYQECLATGSWTCG